MENTKIYLNLKLKCLLPVELYKAADILFACQKDGYITYSPQNARSMHMPKEAVEIAIQTLIDKGIIGSPEKEEKFWKFKINEESIKQYQDSSWDDINNAPVIQMSSETKFTHESSYKQVELSAEEMMQQIKQLQAMISQKVKEDERLKQQKGIFAQIRDENDGVSNLPW